MYAIKTNGELVGYITDYTQTAAMCYATKPKQRAYARR